MISWLSMLRDWWISWKSWVMKHCYKILGKDLLRNLLLIMFGTLKTEERLKDQWQAWSKDWKAVLMKCRREEEDLLSIFIKRKANLMSSKKASTKVSARRVLSSKSSVQFNLKICWGRLQKMLLRKLCRVLFHHRVDLVSSPKSNISASRTVQISEWVQEWTIVQITIVIILLWVDQITSMWPPIKQTAQPAPTETWWLVKFQVHHPKWTSS